MKITVKLFATLRKDRFAVNEVECNEGVTVKGILESLSITPEQAPIIFINSRHALLDTVLNDGDTLAIFPPVGGG